jgi:hypothetical protein
VVDQFSGAATLCILFLGSHEMGKSTDQIITKNLPAFLKSNDGWELVIALL